MVARTLMPETSSVLVDTEDYGYFAVISAFGAPERATPLASHDPRETSPDGGVAGSLARLAPRIGQTESTYLVAPRSHWGLALEHGQLVATRGDFALVRLDPR